jgi:hypothetical protein
VLAGDFSERSTLARNLCEEFGVKALNAHKGEAERAFERVTGLLQSVWDGTADGADTLAQLIEAVRTVRVREDTGKRRR